jgi:predicted outer membrane repeat protein
MTYKKGILLLYSKAAFGGAIYCSKLQQVAEYATQTCSTRLVRHFE